MCKWVPGWGENASQGTVSSTQHHVNGVSQSFVNGPFFDEFTFHSCTTPGLVLAGILKQPGLLDITNGNNK